MFEIRQRGSTVGREVLGGLTTFMAMSYIIFVQVAVLCSPPVNMNHGGVIIATCLSAAVASILMGLLANYPIALAAGMGENFFFAFTLIPAMIAWNTGVMEWKMALALTATAGVVFLLLAVVGFRSYVLNAIPESIRYGIAAGIGLLIATIGLEMGNVIHAGGGLVEFVGFTMEMGEAVVPNSAAILTMTGLAVIMLLTAFRVPGAVLISILVNAGLALGFGLINWPGTVFSAPSGLSETAGGCFQGFAGLWQGLASKHAVEILVFILVLLLMDMFDTVRTLVGVASRAGLMKDGKLPKAERALAADAVGTIAGAGLGSSTVTSYIESITGVAVGARTGLAAIVAGMCMALAIFFQPVIQMIGGGVELAPGLIKYPLVAPAMIFVGAMMLQAVRKINFDDVTEYLPAFLTLIIMPLTFSISHGIAIGFVSFALGKLLTGKPKACPWIVYIVAGLFVLRSALMPEG